MRSGLKRRTKTLLPGILEYEHGEKHAQPGNGGENNKEADTHIVGYGRQESPFQNQQARASDYCERSYMRVPKDFQPSLGGVAAE